MLCHPSGTCSIAAGCFGSDGYGADFPAELTLDRFAAVTLKTAPRRPRPGNPGPVVHHGPDYTVNAVGLRNPGLDCVLQQILPRWQNRGCPVGVSVWAETAAEYRELARQAARAGADYVELNLSCVNAATPAITPAQAAQAAAACRPVPVYAKIGLSQPALPVPAADIARARAMAQVPELAGVIIGNSAPAPTNGLIAAAQGGLSGPRLRPCQLAWLKAVSAQAQTPLIASGGVTDAATAASYRQAGAQGCQVGSAMLRDPVAAWQALADTHAATEQPQWSPACSP